MSDDVWLKELEHAEARYASSKVLADRAARILEKDRENLERLRSEQNKKDRK